MATQSATSSWAGALLKKEDYTTRVRPHGTHQGRTEKRELRPEGDHAKSLEINKHQGKTQPSSKARKSKSKAVNTHENFYKHRPREVTAVAGNRAAVHPLASTHTARKGSHDQGIGMAQVSLLLLLRVLRWKSSKVVQRRMTTPLLGGYKRESQTVRYECQTSPPIPPQLGTLLMDGTARLLRWLAVRVLPKYPLPGPSDSLVKMLPTTRAPAVWATRLHPSTGFGVAHTVIPGPRAPTAQAQKTF